jgi:uncharacterized protein YhaN
LKIVELYIYGYGQLENVEITGLSDFQVFFGENEAGKSTIMAFIHGILFGFPTKQQAELRYEPKTSTKYGGKMKIIHPEFGGAIIERVKGKAAGDVKVVLDNGMTGGEELLKELLANFDKNLFQAIFSFDLQRLQNIHQMKGEDIGKFLFSAGTLGTERLSKAEAVLQKELDSRFKPSGKKPLLNEKLQELHEVNQELKKAAAKNKEYEDLIEKKESLHQEMKEIHARIREMQEKVEKLNEWKRIESIVKEENWIKKELNEMGEIAFPARGLERMEKLTQLIHPYHAEINSLSEKMAQIKQEMAILQPNEDVLENEPAILAMLDQVPLYEQLKLEMQQCEAKLSDFSGKLSVIKEKLHLSLTDEDILSINTNMYMKNQVEIIARKSGRLAEVKEELEERYQEEKKRLEELEKSVQSVQSLCLPQQERMLLEKQVNQENDKKNLEMELTAVQDKIEFYLHTEKQEKAARDRQKLQLIIFEVILTALAVYGLLTRQWVLFLLGAAGIIAAVFFLVKSLRQSALMGVEQTLKGLREKERQIREKLQSSVYHDIAKIQERLKLDGERQEQLQALKLRLNQQESQFEDVIAKFEAWELESSHHKEKLKAITKELKIPENIAKTFLLEAFQLLEQYKAIVREQNQFKLRLKQIKDQLVKMEEGLLGFENRYLAEKGGELHKTAYLLRNKLKEEHEKQIKNRERENLLKEIETEFAQKTKEYEQLLADRTELISAAGAQSVQHFYELGNKAEKQAKLRERLDSLQSQLHYSTLSVQERDRFLQTLPGDELIREYHQEIQLLQTRLKQCQERQAAINYEIQALEEGGIYSDILHHYKQKKFELEEAVKEWAVYCLAEDILSSTIERYKNVHLPKMLEKAEEYLSFLTNANYQRIYLHTSGTGFLIERKDRTLFEANELSQATTEQLYVAIRLALATTLYEHYQFPIMIDDSFVNFDQQRTQKVMELLKSQKHNQILFFTCHPHLLQFFEKNQVLQLEKGAVLEYFIEL